MLIQLFCLIMFLLASYVCPAFPMSIPFHTALYLRYTHHSNAMLSMMQLFLFQYVLNYLHPFHQTHGPSGQSSNLHYHAMLSVTQESPFQCLSSPPAECTAFLFTCMHTHAHTHPTAFSQPAMMW